MDMKFITLYKKNSNGSFQQWNILTEGNVIITRWGQVDGKIQETRDTIEVGKNIGKANETTPQEQANLEAASQWDKKLKKGYVQSMESAVEGEVDEIIEGGIFPMLAKKFSEDSEHIEYPAFAQPKFDGHRCVAVVKDGKATLWTRTRKPITGLPHIIKALEAKFKNVTLDGELYNHDYKDRFEELTSFIRNPEPKEGCEIVQFHIYDWVNDKEFVYRHAEIEAMFVTPTPTCLQKVETKWVDNEADLLAYFRKCIKLGFEGCMVRNAEGLYVYKRSVDLQKVKEFDDAEFTVVRVEEGRGKMKGKAVFVCTTLDGHEFNVKMKGKIKDLEKYLKNPNLAVGRPLTVIFQGYTNKNNVPRFPVGARFRED